MLPVALVLAAPWQAVLVFPGITKDLGENFGKPPMAPCSFPGALQKTL